MIDDPLGFPAPGTIARIGFEGPSATPRLVFPLKCWFAPTASLILSGQRRDRQGEHRRRHENEFGGVEEKSHFGIPFVGSIRDCNLPGA
jgi:hypothetical protein